MHTFIAISFSLKGQDFDKIHHVLKLIKKEIDELNETPILVHGFMPRSVLIEKQFPLNVVDALDELFPLQINCFHEGMPLRSKMAELIYEFGGQVYVVGDVIAEGVQMEIEQYKNRNANIKFIHLPLEVN